MKKSSTKFGISTREERETKIDEHSGITCRSPCTFPSYLSQFFHPISGFAPSPISARRYDRLLVFWLCRLGRGSLVNRPRERPPARRCSLADKRLRLCPSFLRFLKEFGSVNLRFFLVHELCAIKVVQSTTKCFLRKTYCPRD